MSTENLTSILIGLALVAWISYRQLTWTPVVPARMWRMPVILGVIGLVQLVQSNAALKVSGSDVAILLVELVISLGLGAAMGALAHFRPMSEDSRTAYAAKNAARVQGVLPALETRNGWFGMALWLVLIAVRIAGEFWAHANGSALLMSTGVILLTVALNRGVRILIITQRAAHHPAVAARSSVAA